MSSAAGDRVGCREQHLTAAELGAFLGLSASRVRHIIADHEIQACGARWKAKLYHGPEVLRAAGSHDRRAKLAPGENDRHTQAVFVLPEINRSPGP